MDNNRKEKKFFEYSVENFTLKEIHILSLLNKEKSEK